MWLCKGGLVHDGENSPTFHRQKSFGRKRKEWFQQILFFWCIVGNPFENFNICYFAIVPPPKKKQVKLSFGSCKKWSRSSGFQRGGGMDPRGAHLPHPNWLGQISIHQKTGGRFLGALHPPKVYMDGLIIIEIWKKHHFPWTEWVMAVGSFRRSSSRVSRDEMLTQTFLPRSSWKGRLMWIPYQRPSVQQRCDFFKAGVVVLTEMWSQKVV